MGKRCAGANVLAAQADFSSARDDLPANDIFNLLSDVRTDKSEQNGVVCESPPRDPYNSTQVILYRHPGSSFVSLQDFVVEEPSPT
jgi:hypothetical protein